MTNVITLFYERIEQAFPPHPLHQKKNKWVIDVLWNWPVPPYQHINNFCLQRGKCSGVVSAAYDSPPRLFSILPKSWVGMGYFILGSEPRSWPKWTESKTRHVWTTTLNAIYCILLHLSPFSKLHEVQNVENTDLSARINFQTWLIGSLKVCLSNPFLAVQCFPSRCVIRWKRSYLLLQSGFSSCRCVRYGGGDVCRDWLNSVSDCEWV